MFDIANFYADYLRNSMDKVDAIIDVIDDRSVVRNVVSSMKGGKRVRPMIVLLASDMLGMLDDVRIELAAAVELVHMATLLHDDVVDNGGLRRGVATANRVFGSKVSILAGDFLLGVAFDLLVNLGSIDILKIITKCTRNMAQGELAQLNCSYDITIEDYIDVVTAKTADLFGACAASAAILAKSDAVMDAGEFGRNLGIAFQITDDVLDYVGDAANKSIGSDFKNGQITLPAILSIQQESDRKFWMECLSKPESRTDEALAHAIKLLKGNGCIERSLIMAEGYVERAKSHIMAIDIDSKSRDALVFLADCAVKRVV